ncbi:MAG: type I-E CRISPR-associated protein Cse2/CasB [Deltaproteobacteria bacterium]|nr:type I-E CRISPR-associated protein Cse2/CasB [Deltaproteobacteria bacterium]
MTWKRAVASGSASESLKRRFHILLDSEYDTYTGEGDFPYRLRQMVRYAAGKGIGIDWPLLLKHVKQWNSREKWVQKKWAGSYFSTDSTSDTPKIQEEKD